MFLLAGSQVNTSQRILVLLDIGGRHANDANQDTDADPADIKYKLFPLYSANTTHLPHLSQIRVVPCRRFS